MEDTYPKEIALLLKRKGTSPVPEESQIIDGQHLTLLKDSKLSLSQLCKICEEDNAHEAVLDVLVQHVKTESQTKPLKECAWELLVYGVALLELFCQANFTGPELNPRERELLHAVEDQAMHRKMVQHLECDGLYPFNSVDLPHVLLLARLVLSFVASSTNLTWKSGIVFSREGMISLPTIAVSDPKFAFLSDFADAASSLCSAKWWSSRAAVIHTRLLQGQSYEQVPTLWHEVMECFTPTLEKFCTIDSSDYYSQELCKFNFGTCPLLPGSWESYVCNEKESRKLSSMALIEWGLACHHFNYGDKGKNAFQKAKEVSQLRTMLTAALGKRTKYQREDVAQLILFASSGTLEEYPNPVSSSEDGQIVTSVFSSVPTSETIEGRPLADRQQSESNEDGKEESLLEIGRRLVTEAKGGEEAALREVMLDSVDTGVENIILEGGPRFADPHGVNTGGQLSTIDQSILLALCLDVSNSNAADQLTYEEMMAYIERILQQANNWMIHSTALLERSWIEFEKRKTADRAMLQIQALIDQHSTKLTYTQASYKAVEESAPMQERMLCLYQIVYPSVCELKRDLATKYLRCQVFMSALNYFKELEMWDEVVTCYQLMDRPTRAEMVVREQLKHGESPYMLTSLADLTGKEDLYERAWTVSRRRFARAKRTLGKICYDRGQFKECSDHLAEALSVQPLVHTAWYLKGIACMRINAWELAIEAFVRCVQLESEVGEAWANLGAIHMKMRNWLKAEHALQEATKHKHEDFRILENLLGVSLALSKWKEAVRYMSWLVDLRFKQQHKMGENAKNVSPLHLRELAHVAKVAAVTARMAVDDSYDPNTPIAENANKSEEHDRVSTLPELAKQVQALLEKITSTLKSEPEVWDVYAGFNEILGRYKDVMDTRMRQFRAATSEVNWMKDEAKIKIVLDAAGALLDSVNFKESSSSDFYQVKSLLQTTARRMEALEGMDMNHVQRLNAMVTQLDELGQSKA